MQQGKAAIVNSRVRLAILNNVGQALLNSTVRQAILTSRVGPAILNRVRQTILTSTAR